MPPRPTTGALQPQDIYQAAYIDFSKGSYSLAIAGFREFLRRYPDHELAGSAQYWIGEAYLSLARGFTDASQNDKASESLEQAVQEFKKVQANYPRAEKVPTALLQGGARAPRPASSRRSPRPACNTSSTISPRRRNVPGPRTPHNLKAR